MTWPIDRWYVAASDGEIDRSVVAMRDACPDRPVPLSIGSRECDSTDCRYHKPLIRGQQQALAA